MRKCPICDKSDIPDESQSCPNPYCLWEFEVWLGATEEDKERYRKRVVVARRNYQAAQAIANGAGAQAAGKNADFLEQVKEDNAEKLSEYSSETKVPTLRSIFEYEKEFAKRINSYPPVLAGEGRFKEDYDINTCIYPVQISLLDWSKNLLGKVSEFSINVGRDDAMALYEGDGPYPVYARLQAKEKQAVIKSLELCGLDRIFTMQYVFLLTRGAPRVQNLWPGDASRDDSPRAGDVLKEPVTGMEFVWVPKGCYQMGCGSWTSNCSGNEKPVHEVCLDGFWIGKYEVTQGQWKKIMNSNPSHFKSGDEFPVEQVSWNDAKTYIEKLSHQSGHRFALPTEAQWEYAARSGGKYEKYAGGSNLDSVAWHRGNSGGKTHRVGTKAPNGLGIYDMSGNVWEWCEDVYDKNAYSKHTRNNPVVTYSGTARVHRGGSWGGDLGGLRAAIRLGNAPVSRDFNLGFRLALSKVRQE